MQSRSNTNLKGIDISHYQGSIDFNKVAAAAIQIVYIKATEGTSYTDPLLKTYYAGAKAAGLKVGFYHFFRANKGAVQQAQFFVNAIQGMAYDCRLMLDIETTQGLGKDTLSGLAKTFLDEILNLTGQDGVLYTYTSFAKTSLNSTLAAYPLWIADYGRNTPNVNGIWNSWVGFQYSDKGVVPGIAAGVDSDEFTEDILLTKTKGRDINVVSDWAKEAWTKAVALNVFDGSEPGGAMTREMLAVILEKLGLLNQSSK